MVTIFFYTRAGCHLCEVAEKTLRQAQAELGFVVTVVDIDSDPTLRALYNDDVPVTLLPNGRRFCNFLDPTEFRRQHARLEAYPG